jgi:hypothetical protein
MAPFEVAPGNDALTARRAVTLIAVACVLAGMPAGANWARGPWRAGAGNTPGWQLMSPDERVEYQRRMRGFDDARGCATYQAEHRARMAERARKQGLELPEDRADGCEQLRRQGQLK